MLAAWLAMTTASTLKDIGDAGARFGFKDDTGIARTGGGRADGGGGRADGGGRACAHARDCPR